MQRKMGVRKKVCSDLQGGMNAIAADTAEEVWVRLVALDASSVLSSQNRQDRGTN